MVPNWDKLRISKLANIFEKSEKFDRMSTDNLTAYDTKSIMHYDGTLRGFFSEPIMTDRKTGKSIGVNKELSQLDIQKLNKMYPCKPSCGKFCTFHVTGRQ